MSSPSFEEILRRPTKENKPPQPLPAGTYHCMVEGPPSQEETSQKKIPCRVYKFKILRAMEDVNAKDAAEQQVVGKIIGGQYAGAAFYITNEQSHRYTEFLEDHLGIANPGQERSLEELEAEVNGRQLLVKLKHDISQDGKRVYHKIESTMHV
jgi:hypothetical protein